MSQRTKKSLSSQSLSHEALTQRIFLIRGHKVMLDSDLAKLYDVPNKVLLQAVKRNRRRFPADFMFFLEREEVMILRSQFVTSSWGGRRYPPHAFTEQGVAMLSSVLRSECAIRVDIAIMRAFVKLREIFSLHRELAVKLNELERKIENHDGAIQPIFKAIRELMKPPQESKWRIGFHAVS